MNKLFYPKLAANNIRKNAKTYVPYIITSIITVAVFYIMRSLSQNEGIKEMKGAGDVQYVMNLGCIVVAIFALIFLFYTNSFLMKRRKREFGLFNMLGMEKRHISCVIGFETLYIVLLSLVGGMIFGVALDKLMYLIIAKIVGEDAPFGFYISPDSMIITALLFAVTYFLIYLNSLRQIHLSKPIELLKSLNTGEREPKAKWFIAILGLVCLGVGYYMSITTQDPISALLKFFFAVILVIIGTYLLFTAGSITLLKLLKKNKRYYYKTKHFLSISSMLYRMKQNAVGLANICVLSTMVLVMLSSTTSLMVGFEDSMNTRYPHEIDVQIQHEENTEAMAESKDELYDSINELISNDDSLKLTNEIRYSYYSLAFLQSGNEFLTADDDVYNLVPTVDLSDITCFIFFTAEQYNEFSGNKAELSDGEVLIYSCNDDFNLDSFSLLDNEYRVKELVPDFVGDDFETVANIYKTEFVVMNENDYNKLYEDQKSMDTHSLMQTYFGYDFEGSDEAKREIYHEIISLISNGSTSDEVGFTAYAESKIEGRESMYPMIAGFFFLGAFLGILFTIATILIIYYKQISEGYEDKERYEIMQKVGVSRREIKSSISSQILTVFFLPLITAGLHTAVAFPIIRRLLMIFSLTNVPLMITVTALCFVAFAILYVIIYSITARSYYRIVSK